jgi:filamentous hemagglutinin family protein
LNIELISRVTGGNPSNIDGTIRLTIPNADFYFLNPYGIMFGPNARLDVQGSFHASTADYLRLEDGGRFDARNPNDSLLTVAPIEAFGFLTDSPATITTQDSILSVPSLKMLSLIGGHLQLQGTQFIQFDDRNIYAMSATSLLKTTGGTLNLAAIGSSGEVIMKNSDLILTGHGGNIVLNRTLVDTSGLGSGNLNIRGGSLQMQDSTLQANTLGELDGGLMDIQVTESLYATSEPYYFFGFASKTLGLGHAGSIAIKTPEFTLDQVILGTNTLTEANAGNIYLDVTRFNLLNGAGIMPSSIGGGVSGQLTINASESILISGRSIRNHLINGILFTDCPSFIENSNYPSKHERTETGEINLTTKQFNLVGGYITSLSIAQSKAGNIVIQADNVNITEGGIISSATHGNSIGVSGNIWLTVKDTLSLSGYREGTFIIPITGITLENFPSIIASNTFSQNNGGEIHLTVQQLELAGGIIDASSFGQGQGGNIIIQADNVNLTEGGFISSSAQATGAGGHIRLTVKDTLSLIGRRKEDFIVPVTGIRLKNWPSNIAGSTLNQGQAGDINLTAQRIEITGGYVASSSSAQGEAGNIIINADNIDITEGGYIESAAYATGAAGNIQLTVKDNLSISGKMDGVRVILVVGTQVENSPSGIFSDTYNQSQGGHIVVQTDSVDVDEGAVITSNSYSQGDAGQITLQANHLHLQHGSISTTATQSGGGNIFLTGSLGLLYLNNGEITTSVAAGQGSGGDINIKNPTFVVLNQGQITAQADAGNGGNIRIVAEQFIKSYESLVSASSRLGLDGDVQIDSPDENVTEGMLALSSEPMDASRLMKTPCEQMSYQDHLNRLRFVVNPIAGSPHSPYDLKPSQLSQQSTQKILTPNQKSGQKPVNLPPRQTAMVTVCQSEKVQEKTPVESENSVIPEQLF